MFVLASIFAVVAGLVFGSFLNVCISRLPRHESIVAPRSHCPRCLTPIKNRDNIPVLSWIFLGGKCRNCRARIPLRYLLIEVATAALFLLCLLHFGLTPRGVAAASFSWFLLGLAATDAETMLLPDALTLPGIGLGVVYAGLIDARGSFSPMQWSADRGSLLWSACAFGFILLIRGAYKLVRNREGMGLGDAKLLAMIAAWLGPELAGLVFLLAAVGAAVYGLATFARGRTRIADSRNQLLGAPVPLGSFLSAAAILAIFIGERTLNWYFSFFR